jgi:HSP20 family protein
MKEDLTMMDLIRWNPWKEMVSLRDRMNGLLADSLFRPDRREDDVAMGLWYPSVDMFEKDDKVVIKAELPGLEKKDLNLEIKDGVLTLKGERKYDHEVKEENFYRREMCYGKFMRSFTLPAEVEADKITAEFQNGLLTVEVPKSEARKPKQIKVN